MTTFLSILFPTAAALLAYASGRLDRAKARDREYIKEFNSGWSAGWNAGHDFAMGVVYENLAAQERDRRAVADYERHTAGVN